MYPNRDSISAELDQTVDECFVSLGDYESVLIEEFGLAMLRSMGSTPGQAIGGKNKVKVW